MVQFAKKDSSSCLFGRDDGSASSSKKRKNKLIVFGGIIIVIILLLGVSSLSSSSSFSNESIVLQDHLTYLTTTEGAVETKIELQNRDFAKIAQKVFNEHPDDFEARHSSIHATKINNNTTTTTTNYYKFNTRQELYHHYKPQKRRMAGAVIEDILLCHAYSFHKNITYGGSCGEVDSFMMKHKELLDSLGLKEKLPFSCPRDKDKNDGVRRSLVSSSKCASENTRIWTPEYVHYLRSLVTMPSPKNLHDHHPHTIVVHIRRDKVTPCLPPKEGGFQQYLPNLHYLNVIEKYKKQQQHESSKVIIFSQPTSHEPLDVFTEKGYEVSYEEDLSVIWHAYVTADVAIMSRSDFSMIPSLVAQGTVVYTPMWHSPIKGWEIVDNDIMAQTDAELKRLQQESCR